MIVIKRKLLMLTTIKMIVVKGKLLMITTIKMIVVKKEVIDDTDFFTLFLHS